MKQMPLHLRLFRSHHLVARILERIFNPKYYALALTLAKRSIFDHILIAVLPSKTYFSLVYRFNYWSDRTSRSGPGSNLAQTANIRRCLPTLIQENSITSILDAPCGDFCWMRDIVSRTKVKVIAVDIVPAIVEANKKKYASLNNTLFECQDLTSDYVLPAVDLWICRDLIFHLSYKDSLAILDKFVKSDIKYLLITTHPSTEESSSRHQNRDIKTGGFRRLDITCYPFNFPRKPLDQFDDYAYPHPRRAMYLYSREQVAKALITEV